MINNIPKVSVVIPNYNHALYLARRIESVINQTMRDLQIIILDDFSNDNSRVIIDSYKSIDNRIETVYNEVNGGTTFKQWNKGFQLCKGEYIWIAESDDYSDVEFLEKTITKLDSDCEIGLAYCDSWHVYEDKNTIERNFLLYTELDQNLWKFDFVLDGVSAIKSYMSYRNIIPNASAVVFRKSIMLQVGYADESFRLVGDWLYWAKILSVSKLAFVAEPLNFYRHHSSNVRSKTLVNGIYFLEITRMLVILQKYGEPDSLLFNKMINSTLDMWFRGMIEYSIPIRRHYAIYNNLCKINDRTKQLVSMRLKVFLLKNRASGIRQILGDGVIYPLLRKVKNSLIKTE